MTATSATGTGVHDSGAAAAGAKPAGHLSPEAMEAELRRRLEDRLLDAKAQYGQLTITVTPEAWVDAVRMCKEDPVLSCRFWELLDAVDRGEDGFDVYVHLYSVEHRHDITIRTRAPGGREKPVMPTVTGLYRGANWSERETYDMFGIEFEGHPGLLPRILTVENFEGFPLRKDFQLSTRNAKPWPGAKEPAEAGETGGGEEGSATAGEAPVAPEDKAAAAKAKAERAKAKAAEMRKRKAAERAAADGAPAPTADPDTSADEAPGSETEPADVADQVELSDAERTRDSEAAAAADAEPGSDLVADSVEEVGAGDVEGEAAAAAATQAGDPTASTPEGAAEVADSPIAKDAAAGAAQGDMAARAPQDAPNVDEPVVNPEGEAKAAQGAEPAVDGSPGVPAEGRHGGAELQSGDRPAAETPGMTSDTQEQEAATTVPDSGNPPPAPGPGSNVPQEPGDEARAEDDDVPVAPAPGSEATDADPGDVAAADKKLAGLDTEAADVEPDVRTTETTQQAVDADDSSRADDGEQT